MPVAHLLARDEDDQQEEHSEYQLVHRVCVLELANERRTPGRLKGREILAGQKSKGRHVVGRDSRSDDSRDVGDGEDHEQGD
jgi:hypothetical protein